MEHEYLAALLAGNPSLAGREVAVIGGGENNTVIEVGGEYVFRFPRNAGALARLEAEAALLGRIAVDAPVPIPVPAYLSTAAPLGRAYMGYRMLPGNPLGRDVWASMNAQGQGDVAATLGRFLAWLHGQPRKVADGVDLPGVADFVYWRAMNECFERQLFPYMSAEGRDKVSDRYHDFLAGPGGARIEACLVHGDFGPSNILYDGGRGEVSGVIDFGSCGWGDPAVDVAGLVGPAGYPGVAELMAAEYPGVEDLLPRARYYASTFALQEALYALAQGDEELFAECMHEYR